MHTEKMRKNDGGVVLYFLGSIAHIIKQYCRSLHNMMSHLCHHMMVVNTVEIFEERETSFFLDLDTEKSEQNQSVIPEIAKILLYGAVNFRDYSPTFLYQNPGKT